MPKPDPASERSPSAKPSAPAEGGRDETKTYLHPSRRFENGAVLQERYEIIRFLGMGGMGRVYLAHDRELEIEVALKVIRPELIQDEEVTQRLKRELVLARKVSHRNVVRIHDIGEVDGLKYLSMSYIEGKSLKEVLADSAPLEPDRALPIMAQICQAVQAAHQEGVIHRDLKPANIMIDDEGRVFVTDFGVAHSLDAGQLTRSGVVVGTPAYLSPEQHRGEGADAQTDIYALGLIFYEMLTGELPDAKPGNARRRLQARDPRIPPYLVSLVLKCLSVDRARRYRNVESIAEDLDRKQVTLGLHAYLGRMGFAAAVLVAAVLLGWLGWRLFSPQGPSPSGKPQALYSVAVLPFDNATRDPQLDWLQTALPDLLTSDLAHGAGLRVVGSDRVLHTLSDLKLSSAALDSDTVRMLGEVLGVNLMAQGSLTKSGDQLRVDLRIANRLQPQDPVYLKASAGSQEIFALVGDLAEQLKQRFQISTGKDAEKPSSTSLPALKAFHAGNESFRQGSFESAIESFREAIRQDPAFLRSYLKLSQCYERLDRRDEAAATLREALEAPEGSQWIRQRISAQLALAEGDTDRAIEILQILSDAFPNDAEVLFELALAFEQTGDPAKAAAALEKVVQLDENHPQAHFNLARDTILMGDAEKALDQHLVKALTVSTRLNNDYAKADVLNAMGVAYERLGNYDEAIRHFEQSFRLKQQIGNRRGAAISYGNMARLHVFRGDIRTAEPILENSLQIFRDIDDQAGIAEMLNLSGVLYEDQGKYGQALDYYKQALQIRRKLGDDQLTAQSYDNVGYCYFSMGEFDNAEVYWKQSLDVRQAIEEETGIILSLQNMGFLGWAQGKPDEALKSFLEALKRGRSIKFDNAVAVSLGNLGNIYQSQGRFDAALESYQEAVSLLEQLEDKKGLAEYSKQLGRALTELRAFAEAQQRTESALSLAKEIDSQEIIAESQLLLAGLDRLLGDAVGARRNLDSALRIAESNNYQKSLVKARCEEGLLLGLGKRFAEAEQAVDASLKKAEELGDVWLESHARFCAAELNHIRQDFRATAQSCEKALSLLRSMKLKPSLLRLHSMAGQAYLAMDDPDEARKHFLEAQRYYQEISQSVEERYRTEWEAAPEIRQLLRVLPSLEGSR